MSIGKYDRRGASGDGDSDYVKETRFYGETDRRLNRAFLGNTVMNWKGRERFALFCRG